ncbi:MAG: fimbrillin family protein [Prevotellaceae bacterium]|jgi:uncharacterized protein (TIGR02145 family)|nr:fimbrillin family protein [Prevotellaceae bacterium]
MRKTNMFSLSLIALATVIGTSSCVNSIKEPVEEGDRTPILFSTQIVSAPSRITGDGFEEGEKIGLFATTDGNTLSDKRYLDNLELTCNKSGTLTSSGMVYYPEGGEALNFIAYYPYQEAGVDDGKSNLAVDILADQSHVQDYALSDFLVAKQAAVHSSNNPVTLTFQHQYAKLKLVLIPHDKDGAKTLQADNPKLTLSAVNTHAVYDLQAETIANLSDPEDLVPYGAWKVDGDSVVGKEFILIPQSLSAADNLFTLEWDGRIYSCPVPAFEMKGGTQYEIRIVMETADPPSLSGIVGKVEHWKEELSNEAVDSKNGTASVRLSSLSFNKSDVYRIYNGASPVADVCKEYLLSDDIKSRAIVVYPVTGKKETTDLDNGIVLQFLDTTGINVGGRLQWDTAMNSFQYTPGSKESLAGFYIDSNGSISIDRPASPAKVSVVSYVLRWPTLGQNVQTYPVVKIGAQYWLKEDLRTTDYANGNPIAQQTVLDGTPGYFHADGTNVYFYNGEALRAELAPRGWRIPSTSDWKALSGYVNNEAALLEGGKWKTPDGKNTITVEGLTGFNALAVGRWINAKVEYKDEVTAYWTLDNNAIPELTPHLANDYKVILFYHSLQNSGTGSNKGKTFYKGISVRLIKE